MKFLAVSVILALAVALSSAASVGHQEWELFKVIDTDFMKSVGCKTSFHDT